MQTIEIMPLQPVTPVRSKLKTTYEDYRDMPEDGKRYQVIDGELIMSPAPNMFHQYISRNLTYYIVDFLHSHPIGILAEAPTDVLLSNTDIVQPDILVVLNENKSILTKENVKGAPDFLVEIFSPSSRRLDVKIKKALYQLHQVKEYWIVDPDLETIQKFVLKDGTYMDAGLFEIGQSISSDVISGFAVELKKVFEY